MVCERHTDDDLSIRAENMDVEIANATKAIIGITKETPMGVELANARSDMVV